MCGVDFIGSAFTDLWMKKIVPCSLSQPLTMKALKERRRCRDDVGAGILALSSSMKQGGVRLTVGRARCWRARWRLPTRPGFRDPVMPAGLPYVLCCLPSACYHSTPRAPHRWCLPGPLPILTGVHSWPGVNVNYISFFSWT